MDSRLVEHKLASDVDVGTMQHTEISIPVPWGHITAKAWGDPENDAVIVMHGLIDNAGSFDTLIPLLPLNFYYICIDLPGHGFSSHFPSDFPIYYYNFLFSIQYVVEYFQREKYIFLGHSFGGRLSVLFTQLYPHIVSKVAIVDSGYEAPNELKDHLQSVKDSYELLKKTQSFASGKSPSYSNDEVVRRILQNRLSGVLTPETAAQIAKRMTKRVGDDRYEFTYDRRLRAMIFLVQSKEYAMNIFEQYPITCPAISVYTSEMKMRLGANTILYRPPGLEFVEVDGHHHIHHTNPEVIAPILTKFLLSGKSKL